MATPPTPRLAPGAVGLVGPRRTLQKRLADAAPDRRARRRRAGERRPHARGPCSALSPDRRARGHAVAAAAGRVLPSRDRRRRRTRRRHIGRDKKGGGVLHTRASRRVQHDVFDAEVRVMGDDVGGGSERRTAWAAAAAAERRRRLRGFSQQKSTSRSMVSGQSSASASLLQWQTVSGKSRSPRRASTTASARWEFGVDRTGSVQASVTCS